MNIIKLFSWTLLGLVLFSSISFTGFVSIITDWWWFSEVGFTEVFLTSLKAKFSVGLFAGLIASFFLLINFLLAISSKTPWVVILPKALLGQQLNLEKKTIKRFGIIVIIAISFIIAFIAAANWQRVLSFLSATPFGQTDPLFGKDVAFYIFSLPIYIFAINIVKFSTLFSLIFCSAIYLLRGLLSFSELLEKINLKNYSLPFIKMSTTTDPKARMHIGILLALFLTTLAGSSYFALFSLLTTKSGPVFGPAFTDANIMVPLLYASIAINALGALCALYYGISGNLKPVLGIAFLALILSFASEIIPSVSQRLVVAPNEFAKETPYIKHNIAATRQAYNLKNIEERTIAGNKPLTAENIAANNLTIKNVRLWDREPLLSTFSRIQEIRTYYEFASVDNDRYTIDGEIRQIMLSPRELASDSLPAKTWINEHLTFTHGYGITAGPVNQVTTEGLPVLFVKDLPPKAEKKELQIKRPEIYYGELVNDYVIVKTRAKEFDYPKGEKNVYDTYKGRGGVQIDSPLKRVIYALQYNSLKMLLSEDITAHSRIMYNRNIKERVAKIAPFLTYDKDPYLVATDDKLYWILDAYTMSSRYPYSQPVSFEGTQINYIRNSVKAVVDAYDGSVTLYQADPNDPIIKTYAKVFPNAFKKLSDMPKGLASHLRYPEDIFTLQTEIYTTYHMDEPRIFYNKEDQWEVPADSQTFEEATNKPTSMLPRHMIMKLPEEKKEEFILMLPFTPRSKDNLSAWMVARNDGENYGKLVEYRFPKDKLVFGPKQIIARINQDAEVARQITLWDQRGSQVIQGPLLVIPIEESLIYVRPLYLKADSGKIPELKRVIVAYENKVVMDETLEKGLARIFTPSTDQSALEQSTPEKSTQEDTTKTQSDLIKQANDVYTAAIAAQREGDWKKYGEEIQKLGETLKQIEQ